MPNTSFPCACCQPCKVDCASCIATLGAFIPITNLPNCYNFLVPPPGCESQCTNWNGVRTSYTVGAVVCHYMAAGVLTPVNECGQYCGGDITTGWYSYKCETGCCCIGTTATSQWYVSGRLANTPCCNEHPVNPLLNQGGVGQRKCTKNGVSNNLVCNTTIRPSCECIYQQVRGSENPPCPQ